jgi:hypothetical protein
VTAALTACFPLSVVEAMKERVVPMSMEPLEGVMVMMAGTGGFGVLLLSPQPGK